MSLFRNRKQEARVLLATLCVLAAAVIWIRTASVKTTYSYVTKEREWQQLQGQLQEARVRWLKQTSPSRLESLAATLGLQAPNLAQVQKFSLSRLPETEPTDGKH